MEKLEIGNTVKLKGNETIMVVEMAYDNNAVCAWHDNEGKFHREVFDEKMLVKLAIEF